MCVFVITIHHLPLENLLAKVVPNATPHTTSAIFGTSINPNSVILRSVFDVSVDPKVGVSPVIKVFLFLLKVLNLL